MVFMRNEKMNRVRIESEVRAFDRNPVEQINIDWDAKCDFRLKITNHKKNIQVK